MDSEIIVDNSKDIYLAVYTLVDDKDKLTLDEKILKLKKLSFTSEEIRLAKLLAMKSMFIDFKNIVPLDGNVCNSTIGDA